MRIGPRRLVLLVVLAVWLALVGVAGTSVARAQGLNIDDLGKSEEPLIINADGGIEWQRDRRIYVARKNASAQRGQVTVYADMLTAHYREDAQGQNEIWRVEAEGNVRIVSATDTAYGDEAVYDVAAGILVLKGRNLRLVSKDGVLTARDSLEYWQNRNMAVARGAAKAVSGDRTLKGETLVAYFVKDEAGNSRMQRIDAFDNVEVISGRDVAKGERGTYNLDTGIANLFGSVKMSRDKSGLSGEQGVLDTNTGVGRLMPAPGKAAGSPRVRGVIVPPPESGDKDEDAGSPPAEEAESSKPDSSAPTVK